MNARPLYSILIGCLTLSLCACSSEPEFRKETSPVTGEVYVDSKPATRLSVTLHESNEMDLEFPGIPSAVTKEDGKFAISTFETGDGAPPGEYVATFLWGKMEGLSINTDVDKLRGRYADPSLSKFKVKVTEGAPLDMGRIELTTK